MKEVKLIERWEAHHVASAESMHMDAIGSRKLLERYDIDIDSAANGVLMPQISGVITYNHPRWSGEAYVVRDCGEAVLTNYWTEVHKRLFQTELQGIEQNLSKEALTYALSESLHDIRTDLLENRIYLRTFVLREQEELLP